ARANRQGEAPMTAGVYQGPAINITGGTEFGAAPGFYLQEADAGHTVTVIRDLRTGHVRAALVPAEMIPDEVRPALDLLPTSNGQASANGHGSNGHGHV